MATLSGDPVTTCTTHTPAYGLPWYDVECATPDARTGAVLLDLGGATFAGTIMSGGAFNSRTRYRVVGGTGGWGRTVSAKSYANDAGVKLALVLRDVAIECGEVLGPVDPTATVGPAFVRPAGPASYVLHRLCPRAWYVDAAGVTQIGRRLAVPYLGEASRMVNDAGQSRYEIAPDAATLSALVPGVVVDGVEAVDVEHAVDESGALRTTLWGRGIADTSRLSEALRRIVEALTAGSKFHALWEYRVIQTQAGGNRLDLQITRVSSGMPDLRNVRIRPGVAGASATPQPGSLVEVAFLNGDPAQPRVVGFDDQDGAGRVATSIALQAGACGISPTEHATSAEALVNFVFQVLTPLATPLGGAGAVSAAITTALGLVGTSSIATFRTAFDAALAAKLADTSGNSPGLGWSAVRGA